MQKDVCRCSIDILEERIQSDLEILFSNSSSNSVMIFQNLLTEAMNFDDYLCSTWGLDIQEVPLLLYCIQNSEYFGNWMLIDKELYSTFIDTSEDSQDVDMVSGFDYRVFLC